MSSFVPTKIELKPKRYHGYAVLLFIMGTLFPPLAVAARFGIGKDFWLNLLLTICGYIPGHGHNFYIQNIRNNKNHARTPKWAQRYGLVDTSTIERHQRRSQWANRYNDRLPASTLEGQAYAEGQEHASSIDLPPSENQPPRQPNGDLWRPEDEAFYNTENNSTSSGRWHYPANFEDAAVPKHRKEKKGKKDRWARTEDAYTQSEQQSRKKRSKRKKGRSSVVEDGIDARGSTVLPENAEGGPYDERSSTERSTTARSNDATGDEVFEHQF